MSHWTELRAIRKSIDMSIWCGKLLPICSTIKKSLDIRTILIDKIIKRNKDALARIFDDINISQDSLTEESIRKLSAEQQPLLLFPAILTAHIPFDMNIGFLFKLLEEFQICEVLIMPCLRSKLKSDLVVDNRESFRMESDIDFLHGFLLSSCEYHAG